MAPKNAAGVIKPLDSEMANTPWKVLRGANRYPAPLRPLHTNSSDIDLVAFIRINNLHASVYPLSLVLSRFAEPEAHKALKPKAPAPAGKRGRDRFPLRVVQTTLYMVNDWSYTRTETCYARVGEARTPPRESLGTGVLGGN